MIEPVNPVHRDAIRLSQEDEMQAWEYDVIYINPDDLHQKQGSTPLATRALNQMGQQGWEAVTMVDLESARKAVLFKRPCSQHSATDALADSGHPTATAKTS